MKISSNCLIMLDTDYSPKKSTIAAKQMPNLKIRNRFHPFFKYLSSSLLFEETILPISFMFTIRTYSSPNLYFPVPKLLLNKSLYIIRSRQLFQSILFKTHPSLISSCLILNFKRSLFVLYFICFHITLNLKILGNIFMF